MKLLSISTDRKIFERGSAVRARQAEYAKGLEELHIVVFAPRRAAFAEDAIAPNCFVYPTRSLLRLLYPFDAIRLGRFIIERRGITNITCQDASFTAMAGAALKRSFGLPLEIQLHTDIGSPKFGVTLVNRIRKAMSLSYLKRADHIRVVSERIRAYLTGPLGISPDRIEVRPIAVDEAKARNAPIVADLRARYPRFEKIVLMASRLTAEKNVELAIKAMKRVAASQARAGLVIVGSGPRERRLRALAHTLGLDRTVAFEPWADLPTLYSYYKTCDAFLNTSLFEGYGMALVEATAAGAKVVSTDVGIARETGASIVGFDAGSVARGIIGALST